MQSPQILQQRPSVSVQVTEWSALTGPKLAARVLAVAALADHVSSLAWPALLPVLQPAATRTVLRKLAACCFALLRCPELQCRCHPRRKGRVLHVGNSLQAAEPVAGQASAELA